MWLISHDLGVGGGHGSSDRLLLVSMYVVNPFRKLSHIRYSQLQELAYNRVCRIRWDCRLHSVRPTGECAVTES